MHWTDSENTCPQCGGSGIKRNLTTMSPSDDEPCPCTYENDEDEELTLSRDRENLVYKIT